MTLTLDIDQAAFEKSVLDCFASVKVPCQKAMAYVFAEMAFNNLGEDGNNRPVSWKALKKNYANKYHDGDRTPTLILHGDLADSIREGIDYSNEDAATVSCNVPYASMHQWGLTNEDGYKLPPRPFFPLVGNENYSEPTADAAANCLDACEQELERSLR